MADDSVRLEALVQGHVQGVGFRYWTRERAQILGLRGSATNLPDGRVEIIAEGERPACAQLVAQLQAVGRPPGRVDDVVVRWTTAFGAAGFRVG